MADNVLIGVHNVAFGYRYDRMALNGVSLTIPAGTRVAFVGPNGAGKSTLFLHFNAILQPLAGQLTFRGAPYKYDKASVTALRQKVGLVFQDHDSQLFAGSVLDDVLFGPMNLGLSLNEAERKAQAALAAVAMEEAADQPVHFLSHGQKKRVAIAGVLAMEPEVLVMDEPTAGLDYAGMANLTGLMDDLCRQGKTLVIATHDIDWAWAWADLVYVLADGQVVAGGAPESILNQPGDRMAAGFDRSIVGEICAGLTAQGVLSDCSVVPRTAGELVKRLQRQTS